MFQKKLLIGLATTLTLMSSQVYALDYKWLKDTIFCSKTECQWEDMKPCTHDENLLCDMKENPVTGKYTHDYPNGNLETEAYFKDGQKDGVWKAYYEDGNPKWEVNFKFTRESDLWKPDKVYVKELWEPYGYPYMSISTSPEYKKRQNFKISFPKYGTRTDGIFTEKSL